MCNQYPYLPIRLVAIWLERPPCRSAAPLAIVMVKRVGDDTAHGSLRTQRAERSLASQQHLEMAKEISTSTGEQPIVAPAALQAVT